MFVPCSFHVLLLLLLLLSLSLFISSLRNLAYQSEAKYTKEKRKRKRECWEDCGRFEEDSPITDSKRFSISLKGRRRLITPLYQAPRESMLHSKLAINVFNQRRIRLISKRLRSCNSQEDLGLL